MGANNDGGTPGGQKSGGSKRPAGTFGLPGADGKAGSGPARPGGGKVGGSRTGKSGGATVVSGSDRSRTGAAAVATPASASSASRPGSAASAPGKGKPRRGSRRIRLTLARVDPFSVMKMSFLLAIAFGIATIVATALLWGMVDAIGLWDKINQMAMDLNSNKPLPFMQYFEFSKMVSYSVIVSVVNLVIITALGTLLAFLYNIVASLLGGLKFTFTD